MESGSAGDDGAVRPSRPVGRGAKVRTAVLAATVAELSERGYATLSVDGVARRAGVHKTTVYRRWKDRGALVADAIMDHVAADVPVPDTGSADTDLRELARHVARLLNGPTDRAVAAALVSEAAHLPEIAEVRGRVFADRFRREGPVVSRAVSRGELPPGTDPVAVLKCLIAPLYLRLLVTSEPVDETAADHAASVALAAARAGAFVTGQPSEATGVPGSGRPRPRG